MARYTASFAEALSTTTGMRTLETTATGQGSAIRVSEIYIGGEASSSTVVRLAINRPSAAPTGGRTALTCEKLDPASVAHAFFNSTSYVTTQGTLSTNNVLTLGFNAFGGVVRWVAPPDGEVVVGTQGAVAYLIIRSQSGTPTCSGHIIIEER